MSEPASTRAQTTSATHICARCTNRVHTYAKPPPSCPVCGSDKWLPDSEHGRARTGPQ